MRTNIYICIFLCLFAVILSSCIKENNVDCSKQKHPLILTLLLDNPIVKSAITEDNDVDEATLFIYNNRGKLVARWQTSTPLFNIPMAVPLEIEAGEYEIVVWLTSQSSYATALTQNKDKALLYFRIPNNTTIESIPPPLLYASGRVTIHNDEEEIVLNLPVEQLTNRINLRVIGLQQNNVNYSFNVLAKNNKYGFDCSIISFKEIKYLSPMALQPNGDQTASLVVLKLEKERHSMLIITNETTNKTIYNRNLIDLILSADINNDFKKTHKYDIIVDLSGHSTIIIYVNGWKTIEYIGDQE